VRRTSGTRKSGGPTRSLSAAAYRQAEGSVGQVVVAGHGLVAARRLRSKIPRGWPGTAGERPSWWEPRSPTAPRGEGSAGNLTDQPEVRYTEAGIARTVFRVAVSGRRVQEASFSPSSCGGTRPSTPRSR
jgi:hypothetical protein